MQAQPSREQQRRTGNFASLNVTERFTISKDCDGSSRSGFRFMKVAAASRDRGTLKRTLPMIDHVTRSVGLSLSSASSALHPRRHQWCGEAASVTEGDALGMAGALALAGALAPGLAETDAATVGAGDGGGFANKSSHIQRSPM